MLHLAIRTENYEIGFGAGSENSVMLRQADGTRGIERGGTDGVLQAPLRELHHVTYRAVHRKHASCEFPIHGALAVFDVDLQRAKLVAAVGHAGGRDGVGDEDGAFDSLGLQEKLHDGGCDMNSVDDDIGRHGAVGEHFGDDARVAMVEWTHGVESVGGMMCSCLDSGLSDRKFSVGVSDTDADVASRSFGDDLHGAGNFWSDGEHANMASRGLPEAVKGSNRWREQALGRMHSAAFVAEERAFKVNAEGTSLDRVVI